MFEFAREFMTGLAAEVVFTIVAAIILFPIAFVALKMLRSLDPEDVGSSDRGPVKPWPLRVGSALRWIVPGCLVPAAVGAYISRPAVWAGLALYVVVNLFGTFMALGEFESRPRAMRALKALFVVQAPVGVLFGLMNGL